MGSEKNKKGADQAKRLIFRPGLPARPDWGSVWIGKKGGGKGTDLLNSSPITNKTAKSPNQHIHADRKGRRLIDGCATLLFIGKPLPPTTHLAAGDDNRSATDISSINEIAFAQYLKIRYIPIHYVAHLNLFQVHT